MLDLKFEHLIQLLIGICAPRRFDFLRYFFWIRYLVGELGMIWEHLFLFLIGPLSNWLLSFLNTLFLCVTSGVPMTWWKLSGQFVHQSSWSTTRYNELFLLSGTKSPFSAFGAVTKSLVIR